MSVGDVVAEPLSNTGKGIVAGGRVGRKVGGWTGAITGALASLPISGTLAVIGVVAAFFSAPVAITAAVAAVSIAAIGAVAGYIPGALGGGLLGAVGGGTLGLGAGVAKGISKAGDKTVGQEMKELREQTALSNAQVAQAEAYMQQQQNQQAGVDGLKAQRAAAVSNPDGRDGHADRVAANTASRSTNSPSV